MQFRIMCHSIFAGEFVCVVVLYLAKFNQNISLDGRPE